MALETVQQTEPVIAWKILIVAYQRPYWSIRSQYDHSVIKPVKAIAKCSQREVNGNTPVPDVNCSCGFYGYKDHAKAAYADDKWLAKVRFYGKVIEYTEGYRAEKQDILEIWAPEHNGANAYQWPMRKLELLPEQYPTIRWHFPELPKLATPQPINVQSGQHEIHVHYPGGDPYDILSKEMMESIRPGQTYSFNLPITINYAYGINLRVITTNNSLQLEFLDMNNQRVGFVSLTGTRYWWKQ